MPQVEKTCSEPRVVSANRVQPNDYSVRFGGILSWLFKIVMEFGSKEKILTKRNNDFFWQKWVICLGIDFNQLYNLEYGSYFGFGKISFRCSLAVKCMYHPWLLTPELLSWSVRFGLIAIFIHVLLDTKLFWGNISICSHTWHDMHLHRRSI